jgi:tetratricopeptide (TPR) repeat protein
MTYISLPFIFFISLVLWLYFLIQIEHREPENQRRFAFDAPWSAQTRAILLSCLHFFCLGTAFLLLSGCGSEPRQPSSNKANEKINQKTVRHKDDENARWVLFADDIYRPEPAQLAEVKELDAIQQLVDDGLFDQARKRLDVLLKNGAQHPQAFLLRAQLHYQRGELEDVLTWAQKAIEASSYWIEPRLLIAQTYIRLKRFSAAESVLSDLDRLAPELPWGPFGMGSIAAMRGEFSRATQLIDTALQRDARHVPSLRLRTRLAQQEKNPLFEEQLLGRYLDEIPDAAWAHERLGELALTASRLADAKRSYQRAYELQPSQNTARRLAEIAQRSNNQAEATFWQSRAGVLPTPPPSDDP